MHHLEYCGRDVKEIDIVEVFAAHDTSWIIVDEDAVMGVDCVVGAFVILWEIGRSVA